MNERWIDERLFQFNINWIKSDIRTDINNGWYQYTLGKVCASFHPDCGIIMAISQMKPESAFIPEFSFILSKESNLSVKHLSKLGVQLQREFNYDGGEGFWLSTNKITSLASSMTKGKPRLPESFKNLENIIIARLLYRSLMFYRWVKYIFTIDPKGRSLTKKS